MRKYKMFKKILASVLVAALCVTGIPANNIGVTKAYAENKTWYTTSYVKNGDFELGDETGWSIIAGTNENYTHEVITNQWDENNKTNFLNIWNNDIQANPYSMTQKIENLPAGEYKISYKFAGENNGTSGLAIKVTSADGELSSDVIDATTGWNVWIADETTVFTIDDTKDITIEISGDFANEDYFFKIDNIILKSTTEPVSTAVDAGIYVEKINDLDENFIEGVDISSYISEKDSGVKFYDFEGNEVNDQGYFNLLAASGVNWVRIRVWNNPYTSEGKGYGGGNNDLDKAIKMGQWATNAGLKVLIDFHYSDFGLTQENRKLLRHGRI